jgi:SAM-dependent methyltransferase
VPRLGTEKRISIKSAAKMTFTIQRKPDGKTSIIQCPEGQVWLLPLSDQRRQVDLRPTDPALYIPRRTVDTTYPDELLLKCLDVAGFCWLCDEIARDDDSSSVEKAIYRSVFGFVPKEKFSGRRLLDLGCGSGCSSAVLARLLPDTEIVGVELNAKLVDLHFMEFGM